MAPGNGGSSGGGSSSAGIDLAAVDAAACLTLSSAQLAGLETADLASLGTNAIRNLIREAKVAQMYSTIQTSSNMGMQTLDQNLTDLVRRNIISGAEARSKAKNPENFPN